MGRLLTSSKLAIWLIVLLTIEMGIAMLIPQYDMRDQNFQAWALNHPGLIPLVKALKLNEFFTTHLFLGTVGLFWINTFCCTYKQIKKAWQNFKEPKPMGRTLYQIQIKQFNLKEIIKASQVEIEKLKFKVKFDQKDSQNFIIAYRNRWGLWGMAIFHIALLWIMVGAVWGVLNKVEGNTFVVEGFSVKELHQSYSNIHEGLFFNEKHAGFEIKINQVNLKYRGKLAPQLDTVSLAILEDGQPVLNESITPSQMMDYRGYKIKLNRRGFTPILAVDNGGVPQYNLLSLSVHQELAGGETYRDKVYIKDLQKEIELSFFPSPPDEHKGNIDYRIANPQLQLNYVDNLGRNQIKTIGLNEPLVIDGQKVRLVDAKPWVELIIYKTPGIYQVYAGFGLALLGLVIYYGLPYQQLTITLSKEGNLSVATYAKLDFAKINKQAEKALNQVTNTIPIEFTNLQRREEEVW